MKDLRILKEKHFLLTDGTKTIAAITAAGLTAAATTGLFNTITGKVWIQIRFKCDAVITLIKDFQSEKAVVNTYDPQVRQVLADEIWVDLAEACPLVPLDTSAFLILYLSLY